MELEEMNKLNIPYLSKIEIGVKMTDYIETNLGYFDSKKVDKNSGRIYWHERLINNKPVKNVPVRHDLSWQIKFIKLLEEKSPETALTED